MVKKKASKKAGRPKTPTFTWLGDDEKTIYGITFKPGQPVAVKDKAIAARLAINTQFS